MTKHDEKLWARVDYWRERLKDCQNYPALESLESAWWAAHGADVANGILSRNDRFADSPITAIMYCIDAGFYPPPELMLAMLDRFFEYEDGGSNLETAFFGKPVQRAGTYAQRKKRKRRDFMIHFRFATLLHEGKSRADAAEKIALEMETDPRFSGCKPIDADSILRLLRGFIGFSNSKSKAGK